MDIKEQHAIISEICGLNPCNNLLMFPCDLNAMRGAESHLDYNEQVFYIACLFNILGIDKPEFKKEARINDIYFAIRHATSSQCAQAFLQAKGKWKNQAIK